MTMIDTTDGRGHDLTRLMGGDVLASLAGAMGMSRQVTQTMLDLGVHTSQETARCLSECSQVDGELMRRLQEATFRWHSTWPQLMQDPVQWYLHSLEVQTTAARECFAALRKNAEAVSQTLQRMETSMEETTRALQKAVTDAAARTPDGLRKVESRRAA
jgi:hypothetical protein